MMVSLHSAAVCSLGYKDSTIRSFFFFFQTCPVSFGWLENMFALLIKLATTGECLASSFECVFLPALLEIWGGETDARHATK